jgi:hypothetical protein
VGTTESAVIVAVPEAEAAVGSWRSELDTAAGWGVPAHVTVISPFLPPNRIDRRALDLLAGAAMTVPRFQVEFRRVQWFGDSVVWLAPEPAEPFRALTAAVWQAFPESPPYGGSFPDVVPHLTVGEGANFERLRLAGNAVLAQLPIRASVAAVRVICGSATPNSWHQIAELPLGF